MQPCEMKQVLAQVCPPQNVFCMGRTYSMTGLYLQPLLLEHPSQLSPSMEAQAGWLINANLSSSSASIKSEYHTTRDNLAHLSHS